MQANLNPEELDKFADLAATWWDERGPCRPLHDLNPCRLDYLRTRMELSGAAIADVGCGGGIFSEALARKGARVTGIDATRELIDVAREHALESAIEIDYRLGTSSELAASDAARFDAVVCMELIEHVPAPDALLKDCARMVKPNGLLVVSTLNRTPEAYALGIVAAEYAFSLLPRGTHDYANFIKPSELARSARRYGLALEDVSGMAYNPLTRHARLRRSPVVNYFASFRRTGA